MQDGKAILANKKCDNGVIARFKSARVQLKLTQKELALALDIDQTAVSKIEKGKKQLDCYTLKNLHTQFGIDINWILTGKKAEGELCHNRKFGFLSDLRHWLEELCIEEPEREFWLKIELLDKFPLFSEWQKKREAESQAANRRAA